MTKLQELLEAINHSHSACQEQLGIKDGYTEGTPPKELKFDMPEVKNTKVIEFNSEEYGTYWFECLACHFSDNTNLNKFCGGCGLLIDWD